jgi:hypothetical protein
MVPITVLPATSALILYDVTVMLGPMAQACLAHQTLHYRAELRGAVVKHFFNLTYWSINSKVDQVLDEIMSMRGCPLPMQS